MSKTAANWVEELANFLRTEPGVGALRIDAGEHKVSVATIGQVDVSLLEEKLAGTIAAIEERLAAADVKAVPAGFNVR